MLSHTSSFIKFVGTLIMGLSSSSAVMILGLFSIPHSGSAQGMAIYILGVAYNLFLRSLLLSIVEPHRRGTPF